MSSKLLNIPNIISFSRLLLSPLLLLTTPLTLSFFILYSVIGLSDMAGGFIARKYHLVTALGAKLDSMGDLMFVLILLIQFIPLLTFTWWMWVGCGIILLIKIASAIILGIKYKKIAFLHTWMNKICGLVLFSLPFLLLIMDFKIIVIPILCLTFLAALDELFINIRSVELDINIKSIICYL